MDSGVSKSSIFCRFWFFLLLSNLVYFVKSGGFRNSFLSIVVKFEPLLLVAICNVNEDVDLLRHVSIYIIGRKMN